MAKYSELQKFYASDAWRNFRLMVIAERGLICQHCDERVARADQVTLHHIIELTLDNVIDAMISLNPDNVLLVHHSCHNTIHKHGQYKMERGAYLIFGPPLAGKKTFVQERMWPGDLIVDIDSLYASISGLQWYDKPDGLLYNVRGLQNLLLDNIKTRYGRWDRAWIIGGYPDKWRRELTADNTGADIIFIDTDRDTCLQRLAADELRHKRTRFTPLSSSKFPNVCEFTL